MKIWKTILEKQQYTKRNIHNDQIEFILELQMV